MSVTVSDDIGLLYQVKLKDCSERIWAVSASAIGYNKNLLITGPGTCNAMKLSPVININAMRNFLLLSMLLLQLTSCNKNNAKAGNSVEMYLLNSYQFAPGKCQVDGSQAILENAPIIRNEDILQYSRSSFEYKLSASAFERVRKLQGRTPFAITVDRTVIFYGVYMPSIMSSICFDSITMGDPRTQSGSVAMNLAYPSPQAGVAIDDQRNNALLVATFSKQRKLR